MVGGMRREVAWGVLDGSVSDCGHPGVSAKSVFDKQNARPFAGMVHASVGLSAVKAQQSLRCEHG